MPGATLLKVLAGLTALAYIGVNFVAPLPKFLIAENIVYAILYIAGLILLDRMPVESRILLAGLAGFNAGRLSRSIISPEGELMPLSRDHIPLFILLLAILAISLRDLARMARG